MTATGRNIDGEKAVDIGRLGAESAEAFYLRRLSAVRMGWFLWCG